jgi:hypothetical protein
MKLREIETIAVHRQALYTLYMDLLPDFVFQHMTGTRTAHPFVSILVGAPVHAGRR